jgi:hypothetical protein
VKSLESLYAGALRQLTTGQMGLWIFTRPFMEGTEGFMLVYLHLCSLGIRLGLFPIVFLVRAWKVEVGSELHDRKSLLSVKSCNLSLYCCIGTTTAAFPLSAPVIRASLSFNFFLLP